MRVTFDISACNYYQKERMQILDRLVTQNRLKKLLPFLDQLKKISEVISDISVTDGTRASSREWFFCFME